MPSRATLVAGLLAVASLNGCALLTVADAALAITVTAASVAAEGALAGAGLAIAAAGRDAPSGDDE